MVLTLGHYDWVQDLVLLVASIGDSIKLLLFGFCLYLVHMLIFAVVAVELIHPQIENGIDAEAVELFGDQALHVLCITKLISVAAIRITWVSMGT